MEKFEKVNHRLLGEHVEAQLKEYILATPVNVGDKIPTEFELADQIHYEGKDYVVLLPLDEEDSGIVILEYEETGDEEGDLFHDVEDDAVLHAVFDLFKETHRDEFDFEE